MVLPKKIKIGDLVIKIKQENIHPKKGQWDEKTKTITIHKDLPPAGKLVILIHEMLHVTETVLISNKQMKKRVNHDFISAASFGIAYLLSSCDFFSKVAFNIDNLKKLKS